jgi:hypothetical protein
LTIEGARGELFDASLVVLGVLGVKIAAVMTGAIRQYRIRGPLGWTWDRCPRHARPKAKN